MEQHLDDRNRAHIYFYSPIPFVKKSADSKTGIEIKGLGEHRISICTPSIHQNKDHNDSNEYRYQLIKPVLPVSLERKQALDMMYHLDSIYLQNGVEYLHRDLKFNRLSHIINSLQIDPTVEIGEGERHQTLLSAADSLLLRHRPRGKTEEWLKNFLSEINQQLCHPTPLPEDEFNEIWNSALKYTSRIENEHYSDEREVTQGDGSNIIESTSEQIKKKYPIGSFLEQAVAGDSTESDKIIKDDLYKAYARFCKEKRLAVESKENFGKILKKQFGFQDGREASGDRRTMWKGVKLAGIYNLEDEPQMLTI